MSGQGIPRLIVTTHHTTTEFTLNRDVFIIGRSSASDIVIDDPVVSRQHARLERTGGSYKIVDLGSSNGLQYGPEKITEKILKDSDVIRIADSVSFTYSAPVMEPGPITAGTATAQAAPTIWEKLGISPRAVKIWLVVLIVGVVAGFLYGFYTISPQETPAPAVKHPVKVTVSSSPYSSADQRAILNELGSPPSWILVDGPIKPGGEVHRVESWIYPVADTMCDFIDGRLTERTDVSLDPISQNDTPKIGPGALTGDMTLAEVRSLLDEDGEPVEPVDIEEYPDCRAYHFPENKLVISFLDDNLFTAQTYVYMREGE
jgi:hypothetical protein